MISIVIPYYNRPKKLQRCLTSIYEQSFDNYEIIVVDDCSNEDLNLDFSKFQYHKNKENKGPSYCRNVGMSLAQGNYIVFLDCDDYWHRDFLKIVFGKLKLNTEIIMAYSSGYNVDENCNIIGERRGGYVKSSNILPYILLNGRPWGTGACIWDLTKIKNIEWIESRNWEDYAFDILAAINCNRVEYVEGKLVYYDSSGSDKLSKGNLRHIIINKNKSINFIARSIKESSLFMDNKIRDAVKIQILNNCIDLILNNEKENSYFKKNLQSLNDYMGFYYKKLFLYSSFLGKQINLKVLRKIRNNLLNIKY